jgi:hypothetical protein
LTYGEIIMKRPHLLGVLCTVAFNLFTLNASAGTFNVISGTFEVFDTSGVPIDGVTLLLGNGVLIEGAYNGDAASISTNPLATYAGFETALFFGNPGTPIDFYYAPSGVFDGPGNPTYSAPTIDFIAMTADMTSIFANWNSDPSISYVGEFNVGGIAGITALGPYSWELSWSHIQTDGPFTGLTTKMTMVVSQVPLPAAVWFFGSGLLGLIGVARRKKQ